MSNAPDKSPQAPPPPVTPPRNLSAAPPVPVRTVPRAPLPGALPGGAGQGGEGPIAKPAPLPPAAPAVPSTPSAPPAPAPVLSTRPNAVPPRPAPAVPNAPTSVKTHKHTPVSPRISDRDSEKERVFTTKMRSGRASIMARQRSSMTADSGKDGRQPLGNGTIVGQYLIVSLMGEGGFGLTYLAIRQSDSKQVVLKEHMPAGIAIRDKDGMFVTTATTDAEEYFTSTLDEFRDEISTLVALEHPNIVRIEDYFEANGTGYYVMPLVHGTQMEIPKQAELDPAKRAKEARRIRQQLLSMLDAMVYLDQNNVVHRDLKPENIQITPEGQPVILDFGSARQIRQGREYSNMYTPAFCAPEQCASSSDKKWGNLPFGQWTDMYALAACFYYRITRMLPPKAETRILAYPNDPYHPLASRKDLQEMYGEIFLTSIDRALQLEPEARWQHAQDWRAYLLQGVLANSGWNYRSFLPYVLAIIFATTSGIMTAMYYAKDRELDTVSKASADFTTKLLTEVSTRISDLPGTSTLHNSFCKYLNDYIVSVEPTFSQDPELLECIVLGYMNNGSNYAEEDSLDRAAETYRIAEDRAKHLISLQPNELRHQHNLARIQLLYASSLYSRGEDTEAEALINEAVVTLKAICKERPQSPDYASMLVQALLLDTQIKTKRGTLPVAAETLKEVDAIIRKTGKAYPNHEDTLYQCAENFHLQSNLAINSGDLSKAENLLLEEIKIYEGRQEDDLHKGLLEKHPFKLTFLYKRAHIDYNLGKIHMLRATDGDPKELDKAYAKFQDHIDQCHLLQQLDPKRPLFVYEECLSLLAQSRILIMKGQLKAAQNRDEKLNSKTKELMMRAPSDVNFCCLHAESLCVDGAIHRRDPETVLQAEHELAESRLLMEQTLHKANRHLLMLEGYIIILEESADFAIQNNDPILAAQWLNLALEKVAVLKENYPDDPHYTHLENHLRQKLESLRRE